MRITVKVGILFAFGWILVKLSIFGMGVTSEDSLKPSLLINMLFLILAITVGLYLQKRRDTEDSNALRDIKNSLSKKSLYVGGALNMIFNIYGGRYNHPGYRRLTDSVGLIPEGISQ